MGTSKSSPSRRRIETTDAKLVSATHLDAARKLPPDGEAVEARRDRDESTSAGVNHPIHVNRIIKVGRFVGAAPS